MTERIIEIYDVPITNEDDAVVIDPKAKDTIIAWADFSLETNAPIYREFDYTNGVVRAYMHIGDVSEADIETA